MRSFVRYAPNSELIVYLYGNKSQYLSTIKQPVSVHRAPHLLRYQALEVHPYVCVPGAWHLRHPDTLTMSLI